MSQPPLYSVVLEGLDFNPKDFTTKEESEFLIKDGADPEIKAGDCFFCPFCKDLHHWKKLTRENVTSIIEGSRHDLSKIGDMEIDELNEAVLKTIREKGAVRAYRKGEPIPRVR